MENLLEENAKERPLATEVRREGRLPQAVPLLAGSCMPIMGSMLFAPALPEMSAASASTPGSTVLVPMVASRRTSLTRKASRSSYAASPE